MNELPRGGFWLDDGVCMRLWVERRIYAWASGFAEERTHDGWGFRMLCVVDELTPEALAIRMARRIRSSKSSAPWWI